MTDLAINIAQWQEQLDKRTCGHCGSYIGAGDPGGCGPCRTCGGDGVVLVRHIHYGLPNCGWDYDEVPCIDCGGAA